jgi:hypothetical protein
MFGESAGHGAWAVRRAAAERRGREASGIQIERAAELLASPPVGAAQRGEQHHFLSRLQRLSERPRTLALRFYYEHGLTRFVARRVVGLPVGLAEEGASSRAFVRRVVLALEGAAAPAAIVVNVDGQVITCLAPGMGAGASDRASFGAVVAALRDYDAWNRQRRLAAERARDGEPWRLCREVGRLGWLTPRETLADLAALGPSGTFLIDDRLHRAQLELAQIIVVCGPRTLHGGDLAVREWFRATGAIGAFVAVRAAADSPLGRDRVRLLVRVPELLVPMAVGAALARWRPYDGESWLDREPVGDEPVGCSALSCFAARATYFGSLRRLAPGVTNGERLARRAAEGLRGQGDELADAIRQQDEAGLPVPPEWDFVVRLTSRAAGGECPEPDDAPGDPLGLPPLCVGDLALPGGELALEAPRRLAHRILDGRSQDPLAWFCTRPQLRDWRERFGDFDRTRHGSFRLPFAPRLAPIRVSASPARRNDPCPCGSGRKFKRCCLDKAEPSPTGPSDAAVAAVA